MASREAQEKIDKYPGWVPKYCREHTKKKSTGTGQRKKRAFKPKTAPREEKLTLAEVLDLTDTRIRRRLGFSLADLTQEDWHAIQSGGEESWTQAIGRGCRAAGFEGLLAPSARHRAGRNVVVFPDDLASYGAELNSDRAQADHD